jgi:hypothetical protein
VLRSLVGRDLMASPRRMRFCSGVVTSCHRPRCWNDSVRQLVRPGMPDLVGWSRLDGLARQDDVETEAAGGKSGIQKAAGKEATDAPNEGRKGHCSDRRKQAR